MARRKLTLPYLGTALGRDLLLIHSSLAALPDFLPRISMRRRKVEHLRKL